MPRAGAIYPVSGLNAGIGWPATWLQGVERISGMSFAFYSRELTNMNLGAAYMLLVRLGWCRIGGYHTPYGIYRLRSGGSGKLTKHEGILHATNVLEICELVLSH